MFRHLMLYLTTLELVDDNKQVLESAQRASQHKWTFLNAPFTLSVFIKLWAST